MSLSPAELEALTAQLEADGALLHDIVQGDEATVVVTEGGNVPSLAKQLADIRTGLSNGLSATSVSENTIGTGAQAFEIAANKFFSTSHIVLVKKSDDATKWMLGSVTSYVGTTLTLDVTETNGAGTISNWVIVLSGLRGVQGDTGTTTFAGLTDTPNDNVALAAALATKATPSDISAAINGLVSAAPGALDTLNELAAALGDDPDFATTMTNALAGKQASNANLTALAGLTLAADKIIYATGAGALAINDLSTFMRGLLGSTTAQALQIAMGAREVLTAPRTYYVKATGGSDGNDGLTLGNAFATIAKAFSVIASTLDTASYAVTIQLADGTYTGSIGTIPQWLGGGQIIINGNVSTPSNVILTSSSGNTVDLQVPGNLKLQNLELRATAGGCIYTKGAGIVVSTGVGIIFGAATSGVHINVDAQSQVNIQSNYTISGGAQIHFIVSNANLNFTSGITVTLSGTPAFSIRYCQAVLLGFARASGLTFSGSATGARYFAGTNAVIFTNGGGASYFPGDSAGSTDGNGLYI